MKRVNESKVEVDFESVRSLLEFNDCVVLVPRDSFLWNYKRGIQRVLQCSQFPSIYIHSLSPTLVLLYRYFYITKQIFIYKMANTSGKRNDIANQDSHIAFPK